MQLANKSVVAKLLATENITVVQDKVHTASFDVKNRVLTLPMWADTETYVEDHLIGHEVAHALYTPLDGWHDSVSSKGAGYKSFLNVVEDARIEKMIQRKYPGLRRSFIQSYRKLLKDGFFGSDIDAINKMSLIDRINTYFKCGEMAGVRFKPEERVWLNEIAALETWEEVVELTDRLFGFAKEQIEEQKEQQQQLALDDDDTDGTFGDAEEDGDEDDGMPSDDGDADDDFDDLFGDEEEMSNGFEGGESDDDPKSQTDEELRKAIDREFNQNFDGSVANLKLHDFKNWKDYVIPFRDILKEVRGEDKVGDFEVMWRNEHDPACIESAGQVLYNRWRAQNMKSVNHMVKEFEMKKSASDYARALTSKTGVIDTVKMNNYKLTDDIFKKVTIVPDGKNHGFIMYLDMSGSMHNYMYETVEQTLLLVHFARQIGVPFRVYGFSDSVGRRFKGFENYLNQFDVNEIFCDQKVRLLELFSEQMSKTEMVLMAKALLCSYMTRRKMNDLGDALPYETRKVIFTAYVDLFQLGGTPLDSAIALGINLAKEFRQANRIDILNTIFLTDGASHEMNYVKKSDYDGEKYSDHLNSITWGARDLYLTISYNNKTYRPTQSGRNRCWTETLYRIYADATGSTNIGYRIIPNGVRHLENDYRRATMKYEYLENLDEMAKKYRKEGYLSTTEAEGIDEQFFISIKSLTILDSKMDKVEAGESKGKIRSAFKNSMTGSKRSRKMLLDVVERVA